ncbi:GIY-YIG nuclease family protein [bacterium]|nr:GIY-YIG nuclease family protein [bacterium]
MWYVYILECSDKTLYTGITTNLSKRLNQHNKGIGSKYTFARKPVKYVYSEKCPDRSFATKREKSIKSWPRKKKIELLKSKSL